MDGGRKHDYFHSLNYTLPCSHVNREAGRQAGTHACTHAGLFIQLRARAFDSRPSPPTTDCPDFEPNTKGISTRRRIGRLDSVARASVKMEMAARRIEEGTSVGSVGKRRAEATSVFLQRWKLRTVRGPILCSGRSEFSRYVIIPG